MKLDLLKTVLLFASIHLLIVWVAERQKVKAQITKSGTVKNGQVVLKSKIPATVSFAGVLNAR